LLPVAAETRLEHAGLPEPPPWKRDPGEPRRDPGSLRLSGFYSKPELQKLNRNSIYVFINKRLIRDRLLLHAVTEAYRNVIPPTSFPVVLLFLDLPPEEVDVNVHPAKTEVRFRQQTHIHDFVRDSLRTALIRARPAAGFLTAIDAQPSASPSLMHPAASPLPGSPGNQQPPPLPNSDPIADETAHAGSEPFHLTPLAIFPVPGQLPFAGSIPGQNLPAATLTDAAAAILSHPQSSSKCGSTPSDPTFYTDGSAIETGRIEAEQAATNLNQLGLLKPIGQLRESFILATGQGGLWIIDQHVAHERVLFEKILRERKAEQVQRQRLLMPLLVELRPDQMVVFARIAEELDRNGFEVEPFGPQTLAVKAAPVGLEVPALERMLSEVIEQSADDGQTAERKEDLYALRTRIAASIACHAAIKINTPLDPARMEWLLLELARTSHPTSCPHGRPIALLYSWNMILRAFQRV
jgi:DNA mismatch repair protein MutL